MEASSQSHNVKHLMILPMLLKVFLRSLSYCHSKFFHDDGCNKINELLNFKCNLVSRFNKLRDIATKLH